jgi:hypothetical protein
MGHILCCEHSLRWKNILKFVYYFMILISPETEFPFSSLLFIVYILKYFYC